LTPPAKQVRPLALSSMLVVMFVAGKAKADADAPAGGGGLAIVSDSDCPSGEAVRDALLGLRPVEEWPSLSVAIHTTEQMLEVEIGSQKTNPRQLIVGPDCATRATAVALVITTWTGELPVEASGTPVLQPSAVVPQPSAAKESARAAPKAEARQSEIGAGLLAATAGGIVPGLRVEFGRMRRGSGLGWRVDVTVPAAREKALGGGTTRWMRTSAGVGLVARWARRRFFLDGELGGVAGLSYAWGQGYVADQSDWSPTWGLVAGIRAGVPWGRTRIWIDMRACKWLREQSVQIDPVTTGAAITASLPSWDAQGAIGISYIFQ
jgi:hypothetical protein